MAVIGSDRFIRLDIEHSVHSTCRYDPVRMRAECMLSRLASDPLQSMRSIGKVVLCSGRR